MISDNLLKDLALDWRRPYFKVKLKGHDQYYFAQFGLLSPNSHYPAKAQLDAYKENDWISYKSGNSSASWFFINITSWDIESLEIIEFEKTEKQKPVKFIAIKKSEQLYVSSFPQDTLKDWNLKAMSLIKDEKLWKQFLNGNKVISK